jgi:DNA-binding NtrC family response regulator
MEELRRKILIVDDEPMVRDSLRLLLKTTFDVSTASDGEEALGVFDQAKPDLVLLDVMMPKIDGIEVLKRLRERGVKTPVIMLTAVNTVRAAVEAMKCGACDFLNKPFDVQELTALILATLDQSQVEEEAPTARRKSGVAVVADFGPMVGRSAAMSELFARIDQVAVRDTTVLITGESGTGKELVARQIHERSARKNGPFVAINCAAIPETLIESELFGHEKGAFTGAIKTRKGVFERADAGTLFLDEIGELSLDVQAKLLRALQTGEIQRVGGEKIINVDVRLIAATNRDLLERVQSNEFREDLYYR